MKILVSGSAGHLGEALVRTLRDSAAEVVGVDIKDSVFTSVVGSIADRDCVKRCLQGVDAVVHAATLHKPHVVTHSMQDFVDTNVTGTLNLLEEASAAGVRAFVFTSTTSVYGDALRPCGAEPAVWVTEKLTPRPRNIYGVTKVAAEDLCRLVHRKHGLAVVVLRTSRFFPEDDDQQSTRLAYSNANVKANEFLHRRVELDDVVQAHLLALEQAGRIGFDRFIISATTPLRAEDAEELRTNAPAVVERCVPGYEEVYGRLGWKMFPGIDRVYVNARARRILGWQPRFDFAYVIECLRTGRDPRSALARAVGAKGYHDEVFTDGPFPVE